MATDTQNDPAATETPGHRPSLRIERIHIRNLKSIRSLDLPGDGLGWKGPIPDVMTIGGANGSGKTTLLEFIYSAASMISRDQGGLVFEEIPKELDAEEACLEFFLNLPNGHEFSFIFVVGNSRYIASQKTSGTYGYLRSPNPHFFSGLHANPYFHLYRHLKGAARDRNPGVVYFPSTGRHLIDPPMSEIPMFANTISSDSIAVRYPSTQAPADALIKRIHQLHFEDVTANDEGRNPLNQLEPFKTAFESFFDHRKSIEWVHGKAYIRAMNQGSHPFSDLSSGEQQIILLAGELLNRWRPGSLILIDEPELHLHESFQTRLWKMLVQLRDQRGGQLIFATQSNHFFVLGDPLSKVLLSDRLAS